MSATPPGKEQWSSLNRRLCGPNSHAGRYIIQFSSIQFIEFHQIHYKSKRPIEYRISGSTLSQTLMDKDSVHKVTIKIRAGNKMSLIYGYLIDLKT